MLDLVLFADHQSAAGCAGYATGQWATFRQWKSAGASVRKGEKAAPVVFWKKFDRKPADDDDDDGTAKRAFMMARGYSVFNIAQVDDYEPEEAELPGERPLVERLEHAEAFVTATGAQRMNGVDRAFYRPATDAIYMPPIETFTGSDTSTPQEAYYGTLLHELTHWTGAEPRCNRPCLSGCYPWPLAVVGCAHSPEYRSVYVG